MDVRTFRASSIQEALLLVRQQMGLEAVVLQTKERQKRGLLRRWSEVEVTAGLGIKTPAVEAESRRPEAPRSEFTSPQQASALMDRRTLVPQSDAGIDLSGHDQRAPAGQPANEARPLAYDDKDLLTDRLETIEALLQQFGQRRPITPFDSIPPERFQLYTRLIEAEVAEEHARNLVLQLQQHAGAGESIAIDHGEEELALMIESRFRCTGPIRVKRGDRRVVALVGPTGVGKTTTIAKLAANFRLRDGVKLGLVTVDTYRVAAVEQLRTYADILELPMKVVTNPIEMRRAIEELSDMDLVLIDTAGRSPREELQLQELKALLVEADVDEVHLVLSLASSPRVLQMTADKFASVGVTSLILTKLDEAAGMGTLLSVAHGIDHPLSYFTTGQDVPDDIETAVPSRATRLILGHDDLFRRSD